MSQDNNDLESLLGIEAEAAKATLPIEDSISKLNSDQWSHLKRIMQAEDNKRSGPSYGQMTDAEFHEARRKAGV
jgi:hypothetical protein